MPYRVLDMPKETLIIGSRAMRTWYPDFKREPKDVDVISKVPHMSRDTQHYWVDSFQYILDNNANSFCADPTFLLTLKMSHAGWDIHWEKTMSDILFLKKKGVKVDKHLYNLLVKDWIAVHGKKWASLKNKDSTTFFKDAVERKYVHDDIHEAVAVYDKPLYESLIIGGVNCSQKGFETLSFEDKILLVKEEVWVTALERYHIPSDFTCGHPAAYGKSLKKLATTMSSGWFKFFILDNFQHLTGCKNREYIEKFEKAEHNNKLRKYEHH
jgi:hypothetical protein